MDKDLNKILTDLHNIYLFCEITNRHDMYTQLYELHVDLRLGYYQIAFMKMIKVYNHLINTDIPDIHMCSIINVITSLNYKCSM